MSLLQDVVDLIRGKKYINLESDIYYHNEIHRFYKDYYEYLLCKKIGLIQNADKIQNLAIGSSHCDNSIAPHYFEQKTYNLGLTSLDLEQTYNLLVELKQNYRLENLRTIILTYSLFSRGFNLSKGNEKWRCAYLHDVFNLPSELKFSKKIRQKSKMNHVGCKDDYLGYNFPSESLYVDALKRVLDHLKQFGRSQSQLTYLEKIVNMCNACCWRLLVLIPPVRKDYRNLVSEAILFKMIEEIKEIVPVENIVCLFSSNEFEDSDFVDTDHLSDNGAKKVSKKLNTILDTFRGNVLKPALHTADTSSIENHSK